MLLKSFLVHVWDCYHGEILMEGNNTAMHAAVIADNLEVAQYLSKCIPDPDLRNCEGDTPLYIAII